MSSGSRTERRGGRVRRLAVLAAVVLVGLGVGAAGGWGAARMGDRDAVRVSSRPLDAANPTVPTALEPDDPRPPLSAAELAYVPARIFSAGSTWHLEVPQGWERKVVQRGIRWTLPGDPDGTYSVRAVPISVSGTTAQTAKSRLADIYLSQAQGNLSDVQELSLTDDTMTATYVQQGRLLYQHSQFLPASATSSTAVFEVTTSGRLEDAPALDTLAEHVIGSVTRG